MPLQAIEQVPIGMPALFPPQSSHLPGKCMSLDAATAIFVLRAGAWIAYIAGPMTRVRLSSAAEIRRIKASRMKCKVTACRGKCQCRDAPATHCRSTLVEPMSQFCHDH